MEHAHQWGEWIAYDEHVVEMGMTDGFRYRRECQVIGCNARHRAEGLVPHGKEEIRVPASGE